MLKIGNTRYRLYKTYIKILQVGIIRVKIRGEINCISKLEPAKNTANLFA